jgi:GxxExxY protein
MFGGNDIEGTARSVCTANITWGIDMLYEQELTGRIIGAAIEVHRTLGPGLLESAYHACLAREFSLQGIPFESQKSLPVDYKGIRLDCGYRLDFVVADKVVVELKAVDVIHPVHEAQLLTYLKLTGCRVGLLINFNVPALKEGIHRMVL